MLARSSLNVLEPIIECHINDMNKNIILPIEYLSNMVKYETDGKRCVITQRKLTSVNISNAITWQRNWGSNGLNEKAVKLIDVIKNINVNALWDVKKIIKFALVLY